SAFAHSETFLMLAFVGGGALGLIPFAGRVGIGVATAAAALAAGWSVVTATRLRSERLHGRAAAGPASAGPASTVAEARADTTPDASAPTDAERSTAAPSVAVPLSP